MAAGLALQLLAAEGELAAFLLGDLDIAHVLGELALVDHGPDLRALLQRVVDHDLAHLLLHRCHEPVVDALGHDETGRRGAALAGGVVGTLDGTS